MKTYTTKLIVTTAAALLFSAASQNALAGSATWSANPASSDWNTAANWTPTTVPNGTFDIATFGPSAVTSISINTTDVAVDSLVYEAGAPPYTISLDYTGVPVNLYLYGSGIVNHSGSTQTINRNESSAITFYNSATAGEMTAFGGTGPNSFLFYNHSSAGSGSFYLAALGGASYMVFFANATAADATITTGNYFGFLIFDGSSTASNAIIQAINGGMVSFGNSSNAGHTIATCDSAGAPYPCGGISFNQSATAANGTFTANGGTRGTSFASSIVFNDTGRAGEATFTLHGGSAPGADGAALFFYSTSSADQATITVNGGTKGGHGASVGFLDSSTGGNARFILNGNGSLYLSLQDRPVIPIGSIEGSGIVLLGGRRLAIGTNNLNTTFAGSISDGDGELPGSLGKTGTGTLTLSGDSSYSDGTIVDAGTLLVKTEHGSATGLGPVQVDAGTLGGQGQIAGAVTIGSGKESGRRAILAPGIKGPGVLVICNSLTIKSDGRYKWELSLFPVEADEVVAAGVTLESGAQFQPQARGQQSLPVGSVFTVIANNTDQPISGTFANLPDGVILSVNGNNLQANYEGGDGNDLTLTVVP